MGAERKYSLPALPVKGSPPTPQGILLRSYTLHSWGIYWICASLIGYYPGAAMSTWWLGMVQTMSWRDLQLRGVSLASWLPSSGLPQCCCDLEALPSSKLWRTQNWEPL